MYAKPGSAATTCTDSNGVLTVTNTTSSDLAIATKPDVWDGLDVLVKADRSMVCGAFVAA